MIKTEEESVKSYYPEIYEIDTRTLYTFFFILLLSVGIFIISALIINFIGLIIIAIIITVAAGLLLSLTFMIWLLHALKSSVKDEKIKLQNFGIATLLMGGIYAVIILFLVIGAQINWFDYYIVNQSEDPYQINGYAIPYLYLKVTTTLISCIAFFLFTMFFDIRKINKGLRQAHKQKKALSEIFFLKEEFVGKYSTQILYKVMGFIIIIGVAMIPYTAEGFLIVLPIILMIFVPFTLIFLLVILIQKSHTKKASKFQFILENTKVCTYCKKLALFSATYCGECGKSFDFSYQYYESMKGCPNCSSINPHNYHYCRYCGNDITRTKTTKSRSIKERLIQRINR